MLAYPYCVHAPGNKHTHDEASMCEALQTWRLCTRPHNVARAGWSGGGREGGGGGGGHGGGEGRGGGGRGAGGRGGGGGGGGGGAAPVTEVGDEGVGCCAHMGAL